MDKIKTSEKIIFLLQSIIDRPEMYFGKEYNLEIVQAFLNGLNVGLENLGLERNYKLLNDIIQKHGYKFSSKSTTSIVGSNLSSVKEITRKVLEIEIELLSKSISER
jgi:hypothetical protein